MKVYIAQVAITNLTELALYSEDCLHGNLIDDELFNLAEEGSPMISGEDLFGIDGTNHILRRMYFCFLAEMLKTPWKQAGHYPQPKPEPKPPFDGVSWLFNNHWITYGDVLRVREAEREYNGDIE